MALAMQDVGIKETLQERLNGFSAKKQFTR